MASAVSYYYKICPHKNMPSAPYFDVINFQSSISFFFVNFLLQLCSFIAINILNPQSFTDKFALFTYYKYHTYKYSICSMLIGGLSTHSMHSFAWPRFIKTKQIIARWNGFLSCTLDRNEYNLE